MHLTRGAFCAVVVLLLGPGRSPLVHGQNPQTPAQPPTFRTTTALVEVDVVVHDARGEFVPGLVADDLTLFEDGKRQEIQQFYLVSHENGVGRGTAMSDLAPDRAHRVFLMVFDEEHLGIDSLMRVKRGAEVFIQEQIEPGDVAGVFVGGAMYKGHLTTDKNELLAGVRSVKAAIENRQTLLAPFREFPRIPGEGDAVRIAEGARELVDALGEQACRTDPGLCQSNGGPEGVENLIQEKARQYVRQARVLMARTLHNLQYVLGGLSRLPGRKTLVLLSEGFFVEDSREALQMIAGQAARGGTTIYSIDGRGQIGGARGNPDVTTREMSRSTTFDTGDDGPAMLTASTGGFVVRRIDEIARAFGLISRDTSTYYVIGYSPTNTVWDGKLRKIEVKARVPGLSVRARKGYAAVPLPPLRSIRSFAGAR